MRLLMNQNHIVTVRCLCREATTCTHSHHISETYLRTHDIVYSDHKYQFFFAVAKSFLK